MKVYYIKDLRKKDQNQVKILGKIAEDFWTQKLGGQKKYFRLFIFFHSEYIFILLFFLIFRNQLKLRLHLYLISYLCLQIENIQKEEYR